MAKRHGDGSRWLGSMRHLGRQPLGVGPAIAVSLECELTAPSCRIAIRGLTRSPQDRTVAPEDPAMRISEACHQVSMSVLTIRRIPVLPKTPEEVRPSHRLYSADRRLSSMPRSLRGSRKAVTSAASFWKLRTTHEALPTPSLSSRVGARSTASFMSNGRTGSDYSATWTGWSPSCALITATSVRSHLSAPARSPTGKAGDFGSSRTHTLTPECSSAGQGTHVHRAGRSLNKEASR